MKKLITLCAVFLSLNLYGCKGGIDRIFSPEPEQEKFRLDLTIVLENKLIDAPVLAKQLKREFREAFEHYNASFMPSEVAVVTEADGSRRPAQECPYLEYKKFVSLLLSQLLQLGYSFRDIHRSDQIVTHDNREKLLYCWLEVNLLSVHGNAFFKGMTDCAEDLYVKDLYRSVLPGFCIVLREKAEKSGN